MEESTGAMKTALGGAETTVKMLKDSGVGGFMSKITSFFNKIKEMFGIGKKSERRLKGEKYIKHLSYDQRRELRVAGKETELRKLKELSGRVLHFIS